MFLFVMIVAILLRTKEAWSHFQCTSDQVHIKYKQRGVCTSDHVKDSIKSDQICSPRPVIIQLPWPNNTDIQQVNIIMNISSHTIILFKMSPTHISVLQCGGGCHRSSHGCVPMKTSIKIVPVMLGKCGIGRGKCDKECAEVNVEEHTECGCACSLPESECQSAWHEYNSDRCRCECKDIIGKRECLNQGKIWNENACNCGCPAVFSCSVGTEYSNITCACEVIEDQIEISQIEDNRIPRSNGLVRITWEIVFIGMLSGVILILLMIIYLLLGKLIRLRKLLIKVKVIDLNKKEYNEVYQFEHKSVHRKEGQNRNIEEISISSGFGSEISKNDLQKIEDIYAASAGNVISTKTLEYKNLETNEPHFSRVIHAIDETLKLLKATADTM